MAIMRRRFTLVLKFWFKKFEETNKKLINKNKLKKIDFYILNPFFVYCSTKLAKQNVF